MQVIQPLQAIAGAEMQVLGAVDAGVDERMRWRQSTRGGCQAWQGNRIGKQFFEGEYPREKRRVEQAPVQVEFQRLRSRHPRAHGDLVRRLAEVESAAESMLAQHP